MARKQELQLYNSMTRKKELFKPKTEGKVGMYVCGVTAYDYSHIGHARAYVAFDVLYRYLEHIGYEVTYVRNFTDVDDKIINRANELGENPLDLSNRFCDAFLADMDDLQCHSPKHQPRVSDEEEMEGIRNMIAQIIKNGCAYEVEGDVYFSVDKSPNYGQLSGRRLEDNRAGKRVAVDSRKKNPADFALWKAAKPGEPHWDSPWGRGRPGWHIECSAMSAHYLGYSFDIHGGGMDLIFPHHENELAQSCAACPETNVSYWLHNGFVTANDEKMSKSLGNFFTIREVTRVYHPLALRHFLMSTHYRSPVNYSLSQLDIASQSVFYIYLTLQDCEDAVSSFRQANQGGAESNGKTARIDPDAKECIKKLRSDFEMKLSDDLHTPDITDALQLMNRSVNMLKKKQQKQQQLSMIQSLTDLQKEVKEVLSVLGLLSKLTYAEVLQQLKEKALIRAELKEEDVLRDIAERAQARENKEFKRGDEIRSKLACKGIDLMDVGKETTWRPRVPAQQLPAVPNQQGDKPSPVST